MHLIALFLVLLLGGEPSLRITPSEWNFGRIERSGGPVSTNITVENLSDGEATVSFISTCDCLVVVPDELRLEAGRKAFVELTFDPVDDSGAVEKDIVIRTTLEGLPKALYLVRGEVDTEMQAASESTPQPSPESAGQVSIERQSINADFYASPGCRSCQRLLERTIPKIAESIEISVEVHEHNILDPVEYQRFAAVLERLEERERAYPALLVGNTLLQGEREIEQGLVEVLRGEKRGAAAASIETEQKEPESGGITSRLTLLPVLAAGLLDGINPCAFTTLIFLISALAVAGRSRAQVLQVGLFFTLAVFVTYLLIGLGFFQAIRMAAVFPVVAVALRWLLVGVLLVFAALSLYDYFQLQGGKTEKVLLQLPRAIKMRLHRDIKTRARAAGLAASSLVLGFLVSIFELACTGQVYFPTLVYVHQVQQDLSSLSYLLLYNVGFIVPLLVVFALSYLGISAGAVTGFFQRSMKTVKLLLALLFLGLAVLTIVT